MFADYDYDHCVPGKTLFDMNIEGLCNHTYFENLPRISEIYNFSSSMKARECCHNNSNVHGYFHMDPCEVVIYPKIFSGHSFFWAIMGYIF